MPSYLQTIWDLRTEIYVATWQTAQMLGISTFFSVIFGGVIGVFLFATGNKKLFYRLYIHRFLDHLVSVARAFPFVILMIAMSPLTEFLIKVTIGPLAACVALTVSGSFFFARLVEQNLKEVPSGVIEASVAMGAHPLSILFRVLLNEARASMVLSITVLAIGILSYSAAAGMIGGGGLGDLAIRYGYYRYQTEVMVFMVAFLVLIVIAMQFMGNFFAKALDRRS